MRNFKRILTHRPGLGLKTYKAYKKRSRITETGQPVEEWDFKNPVCTFYGTISRAKQSEQVKYQQLGHNITHEVIVYHWVPVLPGQCLVLGDRKFFVHDIRNPGELDMFYCIMTEERLTSGTL